MKLIIAIVQDADVQFLMDELVDNNYRVTKLASTGGFLKSGNTTFIVGVEDERVEHCIGLIEDTCSTRSTTSMMNVANPAEAHLSVPIEIQIGGATVFVVDVDKYYRI